MGHAGHPPRVPDSPSYWREEWILFPVCNQVADPGFTRRCEVTSKGVPSYYLANFPQKCKEMKKCSWKVCASLRPPPLDQQMVCHGTGTLPGASFLVGPFKYFLPFWWGDWGWGIVSCLPVVRVGGEMHIPWRRAGWSPYYSSAIWVRDPFRPVNRWADTTDNISFSRTTCMVGKNWWPNDSVTKGLQYFR